MLVLYFWSCLSIYFSPLMFKSILFRNEEAKAARLAREIESNPSSQSRANLENGDEEERYIYIYFY